MDVDGLCTTILCIHKYKENACSQDYTHGEINWCYGDLFDNQDGSRSYLEGIDSIRHIQFPHHLTMRGNVMPPHLDEAW